MKGIKMKNQESLLPVELFHQQSSDMDLNARGIVIEVNSKTVNACLLEPPACKGTVMLFHGLYSSSLDMFSRAVALYQNGFSALALDFPKQKNYGFTHHTYGDREAEVVDGCYSRMIKTGKPVVLLGISMGAVAILMSQARKAADAVVLESPYWTLKKVLTNGMIHHAGRAGEVLGPIFFHCLRFLHRVNSLEPGRQIGELRNPFYIVGGSDDPYMKPDEMREIFALGKVEKNIWIVEGAQHEDFHQRCPLEYEQKIIGFLNNRFGLATSASCLPAHPGDKRA